MKGVHPDLIRLAKKAIELSQIDFGITHGVRTMEEQRKLYAQGRTTAGPIVTNTLKSKHLIQSDGYGHAIDIVCYVNGNVTWSDKYYYEVADAFEEAGKLLGIKYVWGGSWKMKDLPHYEIVVG